MTAESFLEKTIGERKEHLYILSFDKFICDTSQQEVGIHEIIDVKEIEVDEDMVFLYAFETENGSSGYIHIDLNQHKYPISIEVIETLGLPNLSRV